MVWSNFTATKCRGLVSLNQVIKEIICLQPLKCGDLCLVLLLAVLLLLLLVAPCLNCLERSEERFSRNAETELVCRLLLEKKKCRSPGCCSGPGCAMAARRSSSTAAIAAATTGSSMTSHAA